MAEQRDVQQLIQSLTPSGVNNGNPNTAYNNPSIPMMDAFGNWSTPRVNPAATVSFNRAAPALPASTPLNLPRLPSGILGSSPVQGGGVTTPSTGGTITPWTPPVQAGTGGNTPAVPTPPTTGGGVGGGYTQDDLANVLNQIGGQFGGSYGGGGFGGETAGSSASGRGLWDSSPWLAQRLGVNPEGGFDWQQILDVISEPFIRGDFWNAQTNTWNPGTATAALGRAAGIPLSGVLGSLIGNPDAAKNTAIGNLIESMANDRAALLDQTNKESYDYMRDYIAEQLGGTRNPVMSEANKVMQTLQAEGAGGLYNRGYTARDANRLLSASGLGGTGFSAQSTAASSSPYFGAITGDAAGDFVRGMQLASMGQVQSGGDIYGNMYEK